MIPTFDIDESMFNWNKVAQFNVGKGAADGVRGQLVVRRSRRTCQSCERARIGIAVLGPGGNSWLSTLPYLSRINSNSRRSQIIRTIGPQKIKYGVKTLKTKIEKASGQGGGWSDLMLGHRLRMESEDNEKEYNVTAPKLGSVFR